MKGLQVIAEILKREGVEFIACYPHNDLIEACAQVGIRPIMCRQERVGIAIADGEDLDAFALRLFRGREIFKLRAWQQAGRYL